jgi:hypothetical protein
VETDRYLELARHESELARNAQERAVGARRFALRQVDEGLREHFLRIAGRAELDFATHARRARRFEAIAHHLGAEPAAAREAERLTSQARVELVRNLLTACLRDNFEVPLEHLAERSPSVVPDMRVR